MATKRHRVTPAKAGYENTWVHHAQAVCRLMTFEALTEGWARASVLREARKRRRLVRLEAVR